MPRVDKDRWLLLIHQIPPKPNYLRVKVGRRLQRLGAVALKNSVYVLPRSDQAREDFQWVASEIVRGGGEASVCESRFVAGVSERDVEALFHKARDADYAQVSREARMLLHSLGTGRGISSESASESKGTLQRLRRRLAEIATIDFLGARGREGAENLIASVHTRLSSKPKELELRDEPEQYRGRTWVTRKGIHVDRMASGWLILGFIDPRARFKFVSAKGYRQRAREIRFDMFEAEFTHDGDRCTFEVLLARMKLADPALEAIGRIVHDIDLKDSKFGAQEAIGLERLVSGIALAHKKDKVRLERACAMLDDLYEYFRKRASS